MASEMQMTNATGEVADAAVRHPQPRVKTPTPTVLTEHPKSNVFHFPAQINFDVTSHDHVANQRRGRFVIKLAAALFLATLDNYDTPGRCADAMRTLWGHTALAKEYLRRRQPPGTTDTGYSPQQLSKAEAQWKAALGKTVLEADGFQRCWSELLPFFRRSVAELGAASTVSGTVALLAPHHPQPKMIKKLFDDTVGELPLSPSATQSGPLVDLAKVPARGLSTLFDRTVSFLRTVPTERLEALAGSSPEAAFLASRGWLPVLHVLDGVHHELSTDSGLKTLWAWWAIMHPTSAARVYTHLLTLLNVEGELQFMYGDSDRGVSAVAAAQEDEQRGGDVTHLRAAWGHRNRTLAVAVLEEHTRVPLQALADATDAPDGTPKGRNAAWYECVRDTKVMRKAITDVGGRVYPAEAPYQVLFARDALANLCSPLRAFSPHSASYLQSLARRTETPTSVPGTGGGGAHGPNASPETLVSESELMAILQPFSGFATSVIVAALTFASSRLAFVPVAARYFAEQDGAVCGLEVAAHVTRTGHRHHRDGANGSDDGLDTCDTLRSCVTFPDSPRMVLVLPLELSNGLLPIDSALPPMRNTRSSSQSMQHTLFPAAPCAVDARAMFNIFMLPDRGGQWITVCEPPTEVLVDLRLASLWDLWLWYGYKLASRTLSPPTTSTTEGGKVTKQKKMLGDHRQLVTEVNMGVLLKALAPATPEAARRPASPLHAESGGAAATTITSPPPPRAAAAVDGAHESRQGGDTASEGAAVDAVVHLPWELFPSLGAEAMVLRLDAAYRAGLHAAWARWHHTGLQLLRVPPRCPEGVEMGGDRTGTLGGDVLLSLLRGDAVTTLAALPPWQMRENALWDGLAHWMDAVQAACHLPPFSILLPPNVELLLPGTTERRRLAAIGRRKGLMELRRLFRSQGAPTSFFVLEQRTYTSHVNFDAHNTWVIEGTVDKSSGTVTCDEERWTVMGRPEVILAEMRDNHDERVVGMYLRQACVLQRVTAVSGHGGAACDNGEGHTRPVAAERCGIEAQLSPLRLLRFVESTASVLEAAATTAAVAAAPGGVLEELALHAPLRHTHAGCRVSPLACDELVLGAAWPATCIVDYALLPPLREAMAVYCAKLHAAREMNGQSGTSRETVACLGAIPSSAALATMSHDLRCELLRVLTDEKAMELREFYGDALLDYCVAVTVLSYRSASSNLSTWRGGDITESSTNQALVSRTLPRVLRDYWMARRRICNDKRLADCVESLFGAVAMALWVLPIRRRCAVGESEELGSVRDAPAPDADMLLYVAAALLQLLSSGSER